jgi:Serine carboxypeptidase S28
MERQPSLDSTLVRSSYGAVSGSDLESSQKEIPSLGGSCETPSLGVHQEYPVNAIRRNKVLAAGLIVLSIAAVAVSFTPTSTRSFLLSTEHDTEASTLALTTLHKFDRRGPTLHLNDDSTDHTELWYHEQLVDHFETPKKPAPYHNRWSQRYYKASKFFRGPGYPIFVIVAGEGPVDDIMYPFIEDGLAKTYGGFVLETGTQFISSRRMLAIFNGKAC